MLKLAIIYSYVCPSFFRRIRTPGGSCGALAALVIDESRNQEWWRQLSGYKENVALMKAVASSARAVLLSQVKSIILQWHTDIPSMRIWTHHRHIISNTLYEFIARRGWLIMWLYLYWTWKRSESDYTHVQCLHILFSTWKDDLHTPRRKESVQITFLSQNVTHTKTHKRHKGIKGCVHAWATQTLKYLKVLILSFFTATRSI